jgi:hypothetical protein
MKRKTGGIDGDSRNDNAGKRRKTWKSKDFKKEQSKQEFK